MKRKKVKEDGKKKRRNKKRIEIPTRNEGEASYSEVLKSNTEWSTKNKKLLLEAINKYGTEDINAISQMLSHISPEDVESKILEYSTLAEQVCKTELLNKWLNCGLFEPGDSLIPEALLFIHLYEDHPSPSEAGGYDFRAIYKFLYNSCFEQVSYFDLSKKDRNLLCSLLSKVEMKVWPKCQDEVLQYVGTNYKRMNIKRVYPGKGGHSL